MALALLFMALAAAPFVIWCLVTLIGDLCNGRWKAALAGMAAASLVYVLGVVGVNDPSFLAIHSILTFAVAIGLFGLLRDEKTSANGRGLLQIGIATCFVSIITGLAIAGGYGRYLYGFGLLVLLIPVIMGAMVPAIAFRLARLLVIRLG